MAEGVDLQRLQDDKKKSLAEALDELPQGAVLPSETGAWLMASRKSNEVRALDSNTLFDALFEALDKLGWEIVRRQKEEGN